MSALQLDQMYSVLASRLLPDSAGSVLPIIGTIIFVSLFALLLIYVLTDRRRSHHRRMESLILDEAPEVSEDESGDDSESESEDNSPPDQGATNDGNRDAASPTPDSNGEHRHGR